MSNFCLENTELYYFCNMKDLNEIMGVAEAIASQFGYKFDNLLEKGNSNHLTSARNFAYYILHYDYGVSLNDLCAMFQRSNREVCYRIKKVRDKYDKEPAFQKRCEGIRKKLESSMSEE